MSIKFLDGKNEEIINLLIKKMEEFSKICKYEEAALCRDQIDSLRQTVKSSDISNEKGDLDIIAAYIENTSSCIQVFNIRNGINYGNEIFYPKINEDTNISTLLSYFIAQYYMNRHIPKEVILSGKTNDEAILKKILSNKKRSSVKISTSVRGKRQKWVSMAINNAKSSIILRRLNKKDILERFISLQEDLNLCDVPNTIECFDISHTSGELPIGSCVSFNLNGFNKDEFRKFNIKTEKFKQDDYGMIKEVLERRFKRAIQEKGNFLTFPDLVLIDGGKGQYSVARETMNELGLHEIPIITIAKGKFRNSGNETFFHNKREYKFVKNDPTLFFLQRLRDESHRFAISAHRARRKRVISKSLLDQIDGIGLVRKKALLNHFGSARAVESASLDEIKSVEGVEEKVAKKIYNYFHE